jgi:hypothetical protein
MAFHDRKVRDKINILKYRYPAWLYGCPKPTPDMPHRLG